MGKYFFTAQYVLMSGVISCSFFSQKFYVEEKTSLSGLQTALKPKQMCFNLLIYFVSEYATTLSLFLKNLWPCSELVY